jgi:hypothetical protein
LTSTLSRYCGPDCPPNGSLASTLGTLPPIEIGGISGVASLIDHSDHFYFIFLAMQLDCGEQTLVSPRL